METSFPQSTNKYLKAENFQDREVTLTFKGWERKPNEDDDPKTTKTPRTWQQKIKYVLRYSYPEFAIDTVTGEKMVGKDGQPFRNRYYDPRLPHGYTIIYYFEEGQLESGSKPLYESFCAIGPRPGEKIVIKRTGTDKETKWFLRPYGPLKNAHPEDVPSIDVEEGLEPDDSALPF